MLVFFKNPSLTEFQVRYLAFNCSFLSNRWLQVVLNVKSFQEYPINVGVSQVPIPGPTLFLLYINDLLYADDTIF